MNWNHFLLLLTGLYLVYYTVNILVDLARTKRLPQTGGDPDTLYFQDNEKPVIVGDDDPPADEAHTGPARIDRSSWPPKTAAPPVNPGQIESTGGVVLKDLFRLVQADVLQLTKAIPY